MYTEFEKNICFEYNDEFNLIDPEVHKKHFMKYCTDPAVQEEELYPYDDITYPINNLEE